MPRFITIESMLAEFPEDARPTLRTLREDLISRRLAVKIGRSWLTTPEKAKAYFDQIEEEGSARCGARVVTPPSTHGPDGKRKRRPSPWSSGRFTRSNDDAVAVALRTLQEVRDRAKAERK